MAPVAGMPPNRAEVSGALSRQLHIGAVSAVDHAVCHDAGKQGFDRRQNRDRERIRQGKADRFKAHLRKMEGRKAVADRVKIADRVDPERKEFYHQDPGDDCDEGAGDFFGDPGHQDQDRKTDKADDQGVDINGRKAGDESLKLFHRFNGGHSVRIGNAEKVFELADHDRHGNAGGKAGRDGKRDKF